MKISNKTMIFVGIAIFIVYYMYSSKDQKNVNSSQGSVKRLPYPPEVLYDNAQQQLYDWVEDGEEALEDTWDVLLEDTEQLSYYNDK